jgi:hypothetical protein
VAYVLDQLERSELSNAQYIDEDGADAESDVLWFYGHGQPELERAVLKRVVELARAGVTNHNWRVRPMSTSKRTTRRTTVVSRESSTDSSAGRSSDVADRGNDPSRPARWRTAGLVARLGCASSGPALAFNDVATAAAMASHEPLPKVRLYTPKAERRRSHAASLERSSLSSADAAAGTPRRKNSGASSPRGGDDPGGGRLGEGSVNPRLRLGSISVGSPRQRLASISIALSERVTRPRLSSISAGFGELRRRYHRKPKELVPLASTAISYDEYVRTCPPDLKGLFEWSFEKWPGMPMWGANRRLADECRQNRLLIRGPVSGQSRRRCSRRPSRQWSSSFRVITPQRQQSHTPTSFTGSVGAAAKPRR